MRREGERGRGFVGFLRLSILGLLCFSAPTSVVLLFTYLLRVDDAREERAIRLVAPSSSSRSLRFS